MMTIDAVERRFALRVTFHAEAHVDFLDRHDSIHSFDRPVTLLTRNAGMNVRAMRESYEVRQRVNAVPSNLERRLLMVAPSPRDRIDSTGNPAAVASNASLNRRHTRSFGAPGVLVTILAGNFVDAGVDAMAERNWLDHVGAWGPGAL